MTRPARILLVDDEKFILRSIERLLRGEKREIDTASSAAEALALLARSQYDLVISDHRMPDMTGLELMVEVRRLYPDTIRIILTGYADQQVAIEAINHGEVYRFLTKPWNDDELIDVVESALLRIRQDEDNRRQLEEQLNHVDLETVMALAETIELKDPYTKGHCSRVRDYSCRLAQSVGLSEAEMTDLVYGSLLHDCGKIGVSEYILCDQGLLSEEKREAIRRHPVMGFELTRKIRRLRKASMMIRQHHERWDGRGYPDGLNGTEITFEARIIAIADSFDAMTTDRPYHKGMSLEKALQVLESEAGSQFDPQLAHLFCRLVREDVSAGRERPGTLVVSGSTVVDDDAVVVLVSSDKGMISRLQKQLEGYHLLTAENGVMVDDLIATAEPDMLIIDSLTDADGFTYLRKLAESQTDTMRIALVDLQNDAELMSIISELEVYQFVRKVRLEECLSQVVAQALEWRQMLRQLMPASVKNRDMK